MNIRILHNPRCSKSRATLQLLTDRGIEPEVIDYQRHAPSVTELATVARQLGVAPRALLRTGEAAYAELGLADPALSDAQLLQAMYEHPILIERPIVVANGKAAIGRPPEAVLAIL